MVRGRKAGKKNRNYPPLAKALGVARALQDQASGMTVSRLTLAELLNSTPTSSVFKDLVASARFYRLTNGGINAVEFSLTELGQRATGGDEVVQVAALKAAVMNVPPYQLFFEKFKNKKMPGRTPLREFLVRDAGVAEDKTEEVIAYLSEDAAIAGLIRTVKGGPWIDLSGTPSPASQEDTTEDDAAEYGATHDGVLGKDSSQEASEL